MTMTLEELEERLIAVYTMVADLQLAVAQLREKVFGREVGRE